MAITSNITTENLILKVDNNKLLAYNPSLTENQEFCYITGDEASGQTTISVDNSSAFADGDYVLIGEWGDPIAEIATLTSGGTSTTIVLSSASGFDHFTGTKITKIPYTKVGFYRATTLTGTKTQLGTDVSLMADRLWTEYQDSTNTTGYAFFMFTDGTNDSEYCTGVNYTGNVRNSVEYISRKAISSLGLAIGNQFSTKDQLINDVRNAQDIILQERDWPFEEYSDTISVTVNENEYALSGLTYESKYTFTKDAMFSVLFGSKPLEYISPEEMDDIYTDTIKSPLTATATVGATSITVSDSYEFAESGTIYVGPNTVTYTANDESTGTLSGIPASGTGSITTEVASEVNVWQDINPGEPSRYTVNYEKIVLDNPVDSNLAGYKLKLKYLRQLPNIDDFADTVSVPKPFYSMIESYVKACIDSRRKDIGLEQSGYYLNFERQLQKAVIQIPIKLRDTQTTYIFQNDSPVSDIYNLND